MNAGNKTIDTMMGTIRFTLASALTNHSDMMGVFLLNNDIARDREIILDAATSSHGCQFVFSPLVYAKRPWSRHPYGQGTYLACRNLVCPIRTTWNRRLHRLDRTQQNLGSHTPLAKRLVCRCNLQTTEFFLASPLKYIDKKEQTHPNRIDKVPVPGTRFKREMMFRAKMTDDTTDQNNAEYDSPNSDMQAVKTG